MQIKQDASRNILLRQRHSTSHKGLMNLDNVVMIFVLYPCFIILILEQTFSGSTLLTSETKQEFC